MTNLMNYRYLLKLVSLSISVLFMSQILLSQEGLPVKEVKGLAVGEQAPKFEAKDKDGLTYVLKDELKNGPVVLIFYRGQWCPVCNRHLSNIQDSLKYIYEKGATVIAVSPEKPELLKKTEEKTGITITLLHDDGYKIADAFDVTFAPSTKQKVVYNTWLGADLKDAHSDESQRLPVPATFIINTDGIISWRQFDTDYHNRSTVAEIVNHLN